LIIVAVKDCVRGSCDESNPEVALDPIEQRGGADVSRQIVTTDYAQADDKASAATRTVDTTTESLVPSSKDWTHARFGALTVFLRCASASDGFERTVDSGASS
jgi:hypothetical protein